MLPGTGTDIHNTVRCTHGVLIMFHHDQGITQITQMTEGIQQFIIISLMQTDTWLIQNIGNTHQTGTDLGSQTDTLSLSAGQGCCGTGEGQIIQSHIHQKSDSCPDFFQNLTADHLLCLGQFQMFHKFCQHGNGHGCNLKNIFVTYSNSQCFRLQSLPPHSEHGVMRINVSYSCRLDSEPVSRYLRSTLRIKPSKATS